MDKRSIVSLARQALKEDAPRGDRTASFFKKYFKPIRAHVVAKDNGVLCGIPLARSIFKQSGTGVRFTACVKDGAVLTKNQHVAIVAGNAAAVLIAERVALNYVMQLSGIATLTRKFVDSVKGTKAVIMDTRKTHPFLREVEKYAVKMGGACNHRLNLSEGILIKENYLKGSGLKTGHSINTDVLSRAFSAMRRSRKKIIIEVESFEELKAILPLRPDVIMLDNFILTTIQEAVAYRNQSGRAVSLEVSGGVDLANVRAIAETGVEYISIGSLTHSYRSLDFSLEIE